MSWLSNLYGGGGDGGKKFNMKKFKKLAAKGMGPGLEKGYRQGINLNIENLPKQLAAEQQARQLTDAQRIQAQQTLQARFGPRQAAQQIQMLGQLAPGYMNAYRQMGNLAMAGTAPGRFQREALQGLDYGGYGRDLYNRQAREGINRPMTDWEREAQAGLNYAPSQFATQTAADLRAGYGLTPGMAEQVANTIRGRQALTGNVSGPASMAAEAAFTGEQMNNMYQQRLQNAAQGEQLAEAIRSGRMSQAEAAATFGEQARTGRLAQLMQGQQFAENMYQGRMQNALQGEQVRQSRLSNLAGFLQGGSPIQQIGGISPVAADRSFAYVNPNAGYLGMAAQQQQLSNSLAMMGMNQSGQGGGFPWGQAFSAIGSIANAYGGSDRRLKSNIERIGRTPSGLNIYQYTMRANKAKMIGGMADDIEKKTPEAVFTDPSGLKMVDYSKTDIPIRRIG